MDFWLACPAFHCSCKFMVGKPAHTSAPFTEVILIYAPHENKCITTIFTGTSYT